MSGRPHVAVTMTQFDHRVPGGSAGAIAALVGELAALEEVEISGVVARGDLRRPRSMSGVQRPQGIPAGISIERMGLPLPLLYDTWRRFGRPRIGQGRSRYDLAHVTIPVRVATGDLPVVATVHDVFPLTRPGESTRRGASLMAEGLRWIRDTAQSVMVPTAVVREDCVAAGFERDRISVVHWGSDPVERLDSSAVADALARLGVHGRYVLFVGTIEPRKNLPTLIEAVSLLDRSDLTLVIAGADGWGPGLQDSLAGVASPVQVLGHVDDGDLAALLAGASVLCYPSFAEGFGLPVLEGMAAGVPVITSAETACAEVGGDAVVAVAAADPAAWATAIAGVLDDAGEAERLARGGPERAAEFSWTAAARRTLDVYRSALR